MESEDANQGGHQQHPQAIESLEPIPFQWENKWLKGHEYAFMLKNMEAYCTRFGFRKYPHKDHPLQIYQNPQNGMIYFVEGNGVGSQFGFPRVTIRKKYRWKKMNFTTNLPKKNPQVTYIVASAVKSHRIDHVQHPLFRMHAVVIHGQRRQPNSHILCHIRQMQKNKEQETLSSCFTEKTNVSFYRLFAFLHHSQGEPKQK